MRLIAMSLVLAAPLLLTADVTIRYRVETESPMAPGANRADTSVVYMKGEKGLTVSGEEKTIVDFSRQEVTVLDNARRIFATVPAAEYGPRLSAGMSSAMPGAEGALEMLKSAKSKCDSKISGRAETIEGVHAEEMDLVCTMSMPVPEGTAAPPMSMRLAMNFWFASPGEKLRVPGLWQLSGFEIWQQYFMNPTKLFGKMLPPDIASALSALPTGHSEMLRSAIEISMTISLPGAPAVETPFLKMKQSVVELSTATLSDELFAIPQGYKPKRLEELMDGIAKASLESAKNADADVGMPSVPETVKAYVPMLTPLTRTEPNISNDAAGNRIQGMVKLLVTVGPKGNVQDAEVLSGPEPLRKAAADAVRQWTFRPVIRNGAPVVAYTDADIDFTDYSKGAGALSFRFTPDMMEAEKRLSRLEEALPRPPAQKLADLEQDTAGTDKTRRYDRLGELAVMAVKLGDGAKAKLYAADLLDEARQDTGGWNQGNAIHDGHMVLGLVSLREGDIPAARQQLLEAGKTGGSPQLNSFGPNMMLADELLQKGEREAVLQYFELCRKFWELGRATLDGWSAAVQKGDSPVFIGHLR